MPLAFIVLRPRFAAFVFALACLGAAGTAPAQPSGAQGDDFIYRIMRNDTLIDLSQTYTGTPTNWGALQRLNAVADPHKLPIGLELRIPFALIPEVDAQADVIHISGNVQRNGRPLRLADRVAENDVLQTSRNSFLTLRLPDASISSLPANTRVTVRRLRSFIGTGLIDAIWGLDAGAVDSTVAPEGQGTGRYEIRSPISITGVRGTRLRVRADDNGSRTEVLEGSAQTRNAQGRGPRLTAHQGSGFTLDGSPLPVRPLLPAPALVPDGDNKNILNFAPVPGAVAYIVIVAADADGMRPVSTQRVDAPPVSYRAPGPGEWYVLVRAVDDLDLMGEDAVHSFQGRAALITADGSPVLTGYGDAVVLSDH